MKTIIFLITVLLSANGVIFSQTPHAKANNNDNTTIDYEALIVGRWALRKSVDVDSQEVSTCGTGCDGFNDWIIENGKGHFYGRNESSLEISGNIIIMHEDLKRDGDGLGIVKYEIITIDKQQLVVKITYDEKTYSNNGKTYIHTYERR